MEIAAPWSRLAGLFDDVRAALLAVPTMVAATCHLSHSYPDGACLYFTFAATPPADAVEATYVASWDAGQRAVLAGGGNLSHHHGVGLNRSRFVAEALGAGVDVLQAVKDALDPHGILNPGKLGLRSALGGGAALAELERANMTVRVTTASTARRRRRDVPGRRPRSAPSPCSPCRSRWRRARRPTPTTPPWPCG